MKPASFEYHAPTSLADALRRLAELGETGRPLAGGQSLVPMMNFRLARPAHLVDLNGVPELNFIRVDNGELCLGAMTRQRAAERSGLVGKGWSLLQEGLRHIGHVQIRNRGTIGGSLAHAYPAAELPIVMIALNATFVLRSQSGSRTVAARDFFIDFMTTVLEPGELLIEVRVPPQPDYAGAAFEEISRRYGDFALAAAAATVTLRRDGTIGGCNLVFSGTTPHLSAHASKLIGQKPDSGVFHDVARAAAADLDVEDDIHASAQYRRDVSEVLARRVLETSTNRAAALFS